LIRRGVDPLWRTNQGNNLAHISCIHSWRINKSFAFWEFWSQCTFKGPQQTEFTVSCSNLWLPWRKAHGLFAWQLCLVSLSTWSLWTDAALVCRMMCKWLGWGLISQC
jgi:hypothetical protein